VNEPDLLINGQVVGEDGHGIGQALVTVEGSVNFPEIAIIADDVGNFSVRLPPGDCTLQATAPDQRHGSLKICPQSGAVYRIIVR
tara:strand:- start:679 stop:933 length:255 start_codon:yes stop_codon:yes gene_type:complete